VIQDVCGQAELPYNDLTIYPSYKIWKTRYCFDSNRSPKIPACTQRWHLLFSL